MNWWPNITLLVCSLVALAGCAVPGEYTSQEAATIAGGQWSREIREIQTLGSNYKELWNNEAKFETWKKSAIPIFEAAGVTYAELHFRGSSSGTGPNEWSDTRYFSKRIYAGFQQKTGDVRGGHYQIPGRFEIMERPGGGSVRTSRGTCTVRGVPTTIYAFDFYGPERNYFLRCTFWSPKPE